MLRFWSGFTSGFGFEYEFQMARMNRHLVQFWNDFLMPNKYFFTSSQLIKQVHLFGDRQTD